MRPGERLAGDSPERKTSASRYTRWRKRSGIWSASADTTEPAKLWPTSTTFAEVLVADRLRDVLDERLQRGPNFRRCERSPRPVQVGAQTVCPAARKRPATSFQHQAPW
jgi:hypothetical protein